MQRRVGDGGELRSSLTWLPGSSAVGMAAGGQGPEWTPRHHQLWAEGYREGEQELRRALGTIFQRKVQLDTAAAAGMPQGPGGLAGVMSPSVSAPVRHR